MWRRPLHLNYWISINQIKWQHSPAAIDAKSYESHKYLSLSAVLLYVKVDSGAMLCSLDPIVFLCLKKQKTYLKNLRFWKEKQFYENPGREKLCKKCAEMGWSFQKFSAKSLHKNALNCAEMRWNFARNALETTEFSNNSYITENPTLPSSAVAFTQSTAPFIPALKNFLFSLILYQ